MTRIKCLAAQLTVSQGETYYDDSVEIVYGVLTVSCPADNDRYFFMNLFVDLLFIAGIVATCFQ